MPAAARAHDQDTAPTVPLDAVPVKPEHKVGQLTTGELAREASKLDAALKRPFAESVKALLRARLDAVHKEQAERVRKRDEDVAAAKAELAGQDADRAARPSPERGDGRADGPTSWSLPAYRLVDDEQGAGRHDHEDAG